MARLCGSVELVGAFGWLALSLCAFVETGDEWSGVSVKQG